MINWIYEPPLMEETGKGLYEIYPGVSGYATEVDGFILIPLINGEGKGKVSEMIDCLSLRCRIVNVISAKLQSILLKHGWKPELWKFPDGGVDVWSYKDK